MKKCSKCKQELDESCFSKNQHWCKECKRQYKIENKERDKIHYKEYCKKTHNHIIEHSREYYMSTCIYKHKYMEGTTDPNSTYGISVITEHVVYKVLGDCIKKNIPGSNGKPYDLTSVTYGKIDVKSAIIKSNGTYNFIMNKSRIIPDYYFCLGFNENRSKIIHAWIIPSNSYLINKYSIFVRTSNYIRGNKTKRGIEYEIDSNPYDECYQNLDIYSMPEFCNFNLNIKETIQLSEGITEQ